MTDKPCILVVDDDALTRLLVQEVLRNNNYNVIIAEDGLQGLALIANTPPDLVLLDVMMPNMDGFEFLRLLGNKQVLSTPIVMMTAVEDIHCVEQAFSLGAADFISKPIQWLLLPYRIRYVLRQRRAEETLRIANEEQRAIFNSATSGIVLIKDQLILRCNRKLEHIFGYAKGKLNGQPISLWYPDEATYKRSGETIAKGQFHRCEQQLMRKDGSFFWARFSGQALDSTNTRAGFVGIIDDITVEHEAAGTLLRAKEIAEAATKIKSDFLTNMSHEIRTPMNGVLGMLDLLRETPMTATQQDWLKTAHSSAEALLDIINDILDFSKLEAGKFEVEPVDFNLVDLVDDICALLAGRAHAADLELNCALPSPMPPNWRGDPMRIRQVLTNLIGNAVKFTQQGEVSVTVTRSALTDSHDEFRFEVLDTGIGISEASQALLFKPFSQADGATSRRFGGSGLGLSISKKLVELMGGAIGMDSALGEGSRFWFTLPLEKCGHPDRAIGSYDLSGKRVLIVDDNATNRNILVNYLGSWGLETSQADNGSAALMAVQAAAIQGEGHDLMVLDVQMPDMDGLTVAKCLAKVPLLAKLPIILLSSGDPFSLADQQHTGIVQRLLKPVRQSQLFDAIANALLGVPATDTGQMPPSPPLPNYPDKQVLVVEDNKINQKVIVAKLGKFGIVPDLAENGQLALDKLAQHRYDLILMDCQMPVLDGYAATRELRLLEERQGWPRQTVVALTANAMIGERGKCLAAGMDDYLRKPIINAQLLAMLMRWLGLEASPTTHTQLTIDTHSPEDVPSAWDEVAALKNLDNESTLLYELITLFLIEGPKQLNDLAKFQAEGNLAALANTTHALKGTSAYFFAETATNCINALEKAAHNGQLADIKTLTEAVITAVTVLIDQLQVAKNTKQQAC